MHINKGKSIAKTLADRTDYSQNAAKTDDGKYISAYECDPRTVDEEFMLSKREYEHKTGRRQKNDVIAYQIRQSFKPGEVTPEEANEIGYELAMRFTKGRHAFIVATHTDRAHIHNHIIYNSTTLDGNKKFRNFFLSYLAIQKISDRLCVQHGLSIIDAKPYRERQKYHGYSEKKSHRDLLCEAIDAALEQKPKDFEELLHLLMEAGYEIKYGKHIALRGKDQKRFIRLSSLGEGYSEAELRAVILGTLEHQTKRHRKERQFSAAPNKMQLLIDVQKKLEEGKSAGYVKWANKYNLKQIAESVCYIKEHGLGDSFEELDAKTQAVVDQVDALSASIKASEERLAEIAALKKHILNYSRTKEIFADYKKSGYSKKFLAEHQEDIALHRAAKAAFNQLPATEKAGGKRRTRIPTIKELNQEYAAVLSEKKKAYADYRQTRKEMQELLIARENIKTILEMNVEEEQQKQQEKKKQRDVR